MPGVYTLVGLRNEKVILLGNGREGASILDSGAVCKRVVMMLRPRCELSRAYYAGFREMTTYKTPNPRVYPCKAPVKP